MCDYSLHLVASRAAKVGDELVTTKFNNSITRGFAAIGEPNLAVCLLPGTEVAFEKEVSFDRVVGIFPRGKLAQKVARFRQINEGQFSAHHDALEVPDGETVLLTGCAKASTRPCFQLPAFPRPVKQRRSRSAIRSSSNRAAHYRALVGTKENRRGLSSGSGEIHSNQCDAAEERGAEEGGSRDPSRQPAARPVGCGRQEVHPLRQLRHP